MAMQAADVRDGNWPSRARETAVSHRSNKPLALTVMLVALGAIWGLQVSLAKVAGGGDDTPLSQLLFIHLVLGGAFTVFLGLRGQGFLPSRQDVVFCVASAVLANIGPLWLDLTITPHVSAGIYTLIACMTPIFVVVLALILRCEPTGWRKIAAVVAGFASVSIVIVPGLSGGDSFEWLLAALATPILGAVCCVFMMRYWPSGRTALQITTGILLAGCAILVPIDLATSAFARPARAGLDLDPALLALTLSIAVEFFLFSRIIRVGGAICASYADFVAVFAGLGWGFVFFGEQPTGWIGAAVLLGVVALALLFHAERRQAAA